jgi:hypothetical protein
MKEKHHAFSEDSLLGGQRERYLVSLGDILYDVIVAKETSETTMRDGTPVFQAGYSLFPK